VEVQGCGATRVVTLSREAVATLACDAGAPSAAAP
jgi:hypothetical protein